MDKMRKGIASHTGATIISKRLAVSVIVRGTSCSNLCPWNRPDGTCTYFGLTCRVYSGKQFGRLDECIDKFGIPEVPIE